MAGSSDNNDDLMAELRSAVEELNHQAHYRSCMMSAAALVEEAAVCLAQQTDGNRVAELLMLAARIEGLADAVE